jgi:hypothetical protein
MKPRHMRGDEREGNAFDGENLNVNCKCEKVGSGVDSRGGRRAENRKTMLEMERERRIPSPESC